MVRAGVFEISKGENSSAVVHDATALIDHGKWTLCNSGKGIERDFKFKTFKATWDFMTLIANECKKTRHHPEWSNVYNKTHIRWTTHEPEGLSGKDTHMAKFCDEVARDCKEVETEGDEGMNCCAPKKG